MQLGQIEFNLKYPLIQEITRADRCFNIASTLSSFNREVNHLRNFGHDVAERPLNPRHVPENFYNVHVSLDPLVATRHLRTAIRNELDYPPLIGEALNGDLRAHGDAIGGHGLELKIIRKGSGDRYVAVDTYNAKICDDYVENKSIDDKDIIWGETPIWFIDRDKQEAHLDALKNAESEKHLSKEEFDAQVKKDMEKMFQNDIKAEFEAAGIKWHNQLWAMADENDTQMNFIIGLRDLRESDPAFKWSDCDHNSEDYNGYSNKRCKIIAGFLLGRFGKELSWKETVKVMEVLTQPRHFDDPERP